MPRVCIFKKPAGRNMGNKQAPTPWWRRRPARKARKAHQPIVMGTIWPNWWFKVGHKNRPARTGLAPRRIRHQSYRIPKGPSW